MPTKKFLSETEISALAKELRERAGKKRAHAARDMGVSQTSIFHAEESPDQSLTKLRIRMIERYSSHRVVGPVFYLEDK